MLLSVPVAARAADPSAGIKTYNLQTFYYIYRDGGGGIEGTMTLNVAQDGVVKGIYRTDSGAAILRRSPASSTATTGS